MLSQAQLRKCRGFEIQKLEDCEQIFTNNIVDDHNNSKALALITRMTSKGTDLLIDGLHENPDHVEIKAGRSKDPIANHDADLEVVRKILATIVRLSSNAGRHLNIVFGVSGFSTKANPILAKRFEQAEKEGLVYLPNANNGQGLAWNILKDMSETSASNDCDFTYLENESFSHTPRENRPKVKVLVENNAVVVARSAKRYLKEGQTAIALAFDTGLNISTYRYDGETNNTEIGHEEIPQTNDSEDRFQFQSPLDLIYSNEQQKILSIEETFAGAALSRTYESLIKMLANPPLLQKHGKDLLEHLNKFLPSTNRFEILPNSNQLVFKDDSGQSMPIELLNTAQINNTEILNRAKDGLYPLESALVLSLTKRLANTFIAKFGDLLKNPNTAIFVRTHSELLKNILEVSRARVQFLGTLQKFRETNHLPKLKTIQQNAKTMNGLIAVLQDQISEI